MGTPSDPEVPSRQELVDTWLDNALNDRDAANDDIVAEINRQTRQQQDRQ